jgi:hypothetical protein
VEILELEELFMESNDLEVDAWFFVELCVLRHFPPGLSEEPLLLRFLNSEEFEKHIFLSFSLPDISRFSSSCSFGTSSFALPSFKVLTASTESAK